MGSLKSIFLLLGIFLMVTGVAAGLNQDLSQASDVDISDDMLSVELDSHESGWATLALPINGEVPISQITDDCDLENEVVYGYEGQGTSTETINGMRGYAIQLENSCTAEIETSSIEQGLELGLLDNGWTVFSVPSEMSVSELETGCSFNGYEGTNIFEVTLDEGNVPLDSGDTLEGTGLYWIRVSGNDCGLEDEQREASGGIEGDREIHPLLSSDKGVRVVEPGNLESAVEDMAEGGDPRPVFYSMIKLEPGETYRPENTITLSDGQQIHAYGATIQPQHSGPVFRIKREAKIYGGTIDLDDTGATAFRLPGGRRGFPKGPHGTKVLAESGTGSTGFKVDEDNYRGGRGSMFFETVGVDYPVDLDIYNEEELLYFNSHRIFLKATDYLVGIHIEGDDATNSNKFNIDFAPSERSKAAVIFDHEGAGYNLFEGIIRDPWKHENLVEFKNFELSNYVRPLNTFALYDGTTFDSPPMWKDNSAEGSGDRYESSGNEMIDFSDASYNYQDYSIGIEGSGVLVADGSGFQSTLNDAGRRDMNVRIASGTEVNAAGVTVPEDVAIDARGGRLEVDTRYSSGESGIRFREGSLLIGGRIYARMNEGPVITISADGGTIDEPTGPVGTMLQQKRESQAMLIEAVNGGKIEGLNNRITAFAGKKGFRMHTDETGEINNNRLSLSAVNMQQYNLKMHGEGEIADNVVDANLHANHGDVEMEAIWIIDGPGVRDNRVDGHFWDTGRWGVNTAKIERSGGDNIYSNLFGAEYPPEISYNNPPWDVRSEGDDSDVPINNANSNYREIGYDAIENQPELLEKVSRDRLTPPSFSPFIFQ